MTGGFAIAVPGLVVERVAQTLLQGSYLQLEDRLLRLGVRDDGNEKDVVLANTERLDKARVKARLCQNASVVRGLPRVIVLDRGLARTARLPKRWKCERHMKTFAEGGSACCALISKGIPGEYWVCWGVHGPGAEAPDEGATDSEGYDENPALQVYAILAKAHSQDALTDPATDDGWYQGGVFRAALQSIGSDGGPLAAQPGSSNQPQSSRGGATGRAAAA